MRNEILYLCEAHPHHSATSFDFSAEVSKKPEGVIFALESNADRSWKKLTSMESHLKVLDETDLLDALTQHYYRYRLAVKLGGSVDEFNKSRDTLQQILNELNKRRDDHFKDGNNPRNSQSDNIFETNRRSEK